MKFQKFLRKLFKVTLPFSGDKTKIAGWIIAALGVQELGGVDLKQVAAILATPEGGFGAAAGLLAVGLLDKYLKKQYPDIKY